jgi:ribosomal-protein-alanine N-acetyltransferase
MAEGIEIAPATPADVEAIHGIEQSSFPAPWRQEFFRSELRADGRFNLVAKRGGTVVGYLFSMWIFDEMHVNKIAVIEEERRRGIAALLMDRCFAFAREHKVDTIALEVRQSNRGAQEFYRGLGFRSSYVRARYYPDGEAAVVMTCQL